MSKENRKEKPSKLTDDKLETVINPEDRKIKKIDTDHISIKNEKYEIMKDYKEALDLELLEERYSDFLEKYDYIVGDMSYGKLRLRGFYNDDVKKIPIDMRISYLEDYLLEYCSFGCAYFVLKNTEPKKKRPEHQYSSNKKKQTQNKSKRSSNKKPYKKKQTQVPKKSNKKEKTPSNTKAKRSFTKKHRSKTEDKNEKKEDIKEVKNNNGKTRFQIRKKKN
ncbi:MAG: YutD family protein [Alkalibacterium gilvum]|uniref:YutD family protein n=1 Tax=Alkalibacterium gilvum TaxID=1130080 RepID=UPI003F92CD1D